MPTKQLRQLKSESISDDQNTLVSLVAAGRIAAGDLGADTPRSAANRRDRTTDCLTQGFGVSLLFMRFVEDTNAQTRHPSNTNRSHVVVVCDQTDKQMPNHYYVKHPTFFGTF
jgi:hypothetical protein